jgi:haloacetate dehalogenase
MKDDMEELYRNPIDIWRPWVSDIDGYGIDSGHHVAEENRVALAEALKSFFR